MSKQSESLSDREKIEAFESVWRLMKSNNVRAEISALLTEMLDNPDEHGIYPTTKFMDALEGYIGTIICLRRAGGTCMVQFHHDEYKAMVFGRDENGRQVYALTYGQYGEDEFAVMTDADGRYITFTFESLMEGM